MELLEGVVIPVGDEADELRVRARVVAHHRDAVPSGCARQVDPRCKRRVHATGYERGARVDWPERAPNLAGRGG